MSTPSLPIIDIAALAGSDPAARRSVAVRIDRACREQGFFYVVGHGVEAQLVERLERLARQFFALDETSKLRWRMELGGRAWRGYFPLGGELTSNRPDWKEGLYLGSELDAEHPEVRAGTPLHGANLFPEVPGLRETLLEYLDATTRVGHRLMEGIALGLGLEADYFAARYTGDPLILFRLFNYPSQPVPEGLDVQWGVGEHTDYGLLTLLHQDAIGGLQVHPTGLAGGSADTGLVRLQPRRHARTHDRRPLPQHAAPGGTQHFGARPPVVPAVLRSELPCPRAAHRRAARGAGTG